MTRFGGLAVPFTIVCSGLCAVFACLAGCGANAPSNKFAGVDGDYNYSPSVLQSGDQVQVWWCAQAYNPTNPSQLSDAIDYESMDRAGHVKQGPVTVLAETSGSWDATFTCNPRVIEGVFPDVLGDGQTYTYEMFYVGTAAGGVDNSIGAAFSNDGMNWKKYPQPVIDSTSAVYYGVGQPAAYNADGKSAITLFYESDTPGAQHLEATSPDGIHFTVVGVLTTNGLDPNNAHPSWGDMGYDPSTGYWYATYNEDVRDPATTGGYVESGQYGIELYRIPGGSLISGATPWQLLKTVDTNLTGYESNFLAGLLHDPYGNINIGPYPDIEMFPSTSMPAPAWDANPLAAGETGNVFNWVIGSYTWVPGQPEVAFNLDANLETFDATTGWLEPGSGFHVKSALGHLYESPQNGAVTPFFGCKSGMVDYFVSRDPACEGSRILGLEGYGYADPVPGMNLVPLYRCLADGIAGFVSNNEGCNDRGRGTLLGYALP